MYCMYACMEENNAFGKTFSKEDTTVTFHLMEIQLFGGLEIKSLRPANWDIGISRTFI